jgi:hypothetical protein
MCRPNVRVPFFPTGTRVDEADGKKREQERDQDKQAAQEETDVYLVCKAVHSDATAVLFFELLAVTEDLQDATTYARQSFCELSRLSVDFNLFFDANPMAAHRHAHHSTRARVLKAFAHCPAHACLRTCFAYACMRMPHAFDLAGQQLPFACLASFRSVRDAGAARGGRGVLRHVRARLC